MGEGNTALYNPAGSNIDLSGLTSNNQASLSDSQDKKADQILRESQVASSKPPLIFSFGPTWPEGMRYKVSPSLFNEVEAAYRGYGTLSSSARKYLLSLYNYHPEWRQFINQILNMK
jgi:hypothetical protein